MDISILSDFNPWWAKGTVPEMLLGDRERPVVTAIKDNLDLRFIVLLYGLRRVGKTTALYQTIRHLLGKNTNPYNILYFSFDDEKAEIRDIIREYEEKILKKRISGCKGRVFAFFDEIQKVKDWQNKVKTLYDLNPNLKIFLSGSASASIQRGATESLAGRMVSIFVNPLSFSEFLEWKGVKADTKRPEITQRDMQPLLMDYLRKGGFPEITHEERDGAIRSYVKDTVIERIIYKDIPQEFELKDLGLMKFLIESFIRNPGAILNVEKLSRELGKSKITIGNYIEYLEFSLLITQIKNLRQNLLVSSRKGRKVYPTNTALCFAYLSDFYSDRVLEKVAEVAVAGHIAAKYYYRNGFEIDFVDKRGKDAIPVEVKYGKPEQHQITQFMQKFNVKKGVIVSKETIQPDRNGLEITPLWLFMLRETAQKSMAGALAGNKKYNRKDILSGLRDERDNFR